MHGGKIREEIGAIWKPFTSWRWLSALLFLLVLARLTSTTARGIEASDLLVFSKGPVSIRPQLTTFAIYNDNIYYRKTNVLGDTIIGLTPGVRILLGEDLPAANHIGVRYSAEKSFYMDQTDLDALQHRFLLDGRFATERTTIEGLDQWDFLSSTLGGGYTSVAGQKIGRTVSHDRYRLDYRIGERMGAYIVGDHSATDYEKGINLFDIRAIEGTLGFEWVLSPRTHIFGEAYYGVTTVQSNVGATDPPGDSFVGGFVGARGDFTEKLKGSVKGGYEAFQFEKGGTVAGTSDSGSAPVVEADLTYQMTERTTLRLTYSRRQYISVEFKGLSYTVDDIGIRAGVILGSTGKVRVDAASSFGSYQFERSVYFNSKARSDTIWTSSLNVRWTIQTWLSTGLEFRHSQLTSDTAGVVDYSQNQIQWFVSIGY